jgi:hypothetical protein
VSTVACVLMIGALGALSYFLETTGNHYEHPSTRTPVPADDDDERWSW